MRAVNFVGSPETRIDFCLDFSPDNKITDDLETFKIVLMYICNFELAAPSIAFAETLILSLFP